VYIEDLSPSEIAINLTAIEFGTRMRFYLSPHLLQLLDSSPFLCDSCCVCTCVPLAYFEKVRPDELFHMNWQKPDRETLAPNILSLTQRFNQVRNPIPPLLCGVGPC
jgi:hypothetical protein